jgi:malic enzyme
MLMDNFMKMAPIIYTPTVGWACLNYSNLIARPRGMIFRGEDKGGIKKISHFKNKNN